MLPGNVSLSIRVLTITNFIFGSAAFGAQRIPASTSMTMVPQKQFCDGMMTELSKYAVAEGLSPRGARKFASSTSQIIQKQLRQGDFDPYFETTSLQSPSSREPDPAVRRWIDVSEVVTAALGRIPGNVLSVTSTDDLKMVSQVAPGAQILLVASSLGVLTVERAHSVAEAALFGKIQINIIWVGPISSSAREAKEVLASLAQATKGAFLDLSSARTCTGI